MRSIKALLQPGCPAKVCRVVAFDALAGQWTAELNFLVLVHGLSERASIERLCRDGLSNVWWVEADVLEEGDVIVPWESRGELAVLLRESDLHHSLFMTNRCNSYCLMCSQPPTQHEDGWLVEEALDAIRHLRSSPKVLGLTGGEPLLLGTGLRRVLEAIGKQHPETVVEVLTNGRLFSNQAITSSIVDGCATKVRWLIPMYGHADFVHDFVVQSHGAFDETLAGLLALRARGQEIQLRIVLIEPVLQVLPELVGFVGRNFPFVREVALMGCEPIGFALANRSMCEVDLNEWRQQLDISVRILNRHAVPFLFMNIPLCALPVELWRYAHKSISDWKNVYAEACDDCMMKEQCTGLFAWHEKGWRPAPLKVITKTGSGV